MPICSTKPTFFKTSSVEPGLLDRLVLLTVSPSAKQTLLGEWVLVNSYVALPKLVAVNKQRRWTSNEQIQQFLNEWNVLHAY